MLSNYELAHMAKKHKVKLNFCNYKDLMPKYKYGSFNGIINMDSSPPDDGNVAGSHWIVLVIRNGHCFYCDSFGQPPPLEIQLFIKSQNCKHYGINKTTFQHLDSTMCGYFAFGLMLALKRHKGSLYDICDDYISIFDVKNTKLNDKIVMKFIDSS